MIKNQTPIISTVKPTTMTREALRAKLVQRQLLEQRTQQCPGSTEYFCLFVYNLNICPCSSQTLSSINNPSHPASL